jgi:hypothetical protein
MKHLKCLGPAAFAALAITALFGAGTASATTLQSGGKNLPTGTEIVTTLKSGTTSLIKDTFGTVVQTCTQSENKLKTTNETGTTVNGTIVSQTTGSCSHSALVLKNGEMKIEWTSGNNGKVIASGSETTFFSTLFGASCIGKTANTNVGTLTGSTTGNATMDINGVIETGFCGDVVWTATYTVTKPTTLAVVK